MVDYCFLGADAAEDLISHSPGGTRGLFASTWRLLLESCLPGRRRRLPAPAGSQARQFAAVGGGDLVNHEGSIVFVGAGAGNGNLFTSQGLGPVADLKGDRHLVLCHFVGNGVQRPPRVDHVVHMVVQVQVRPPDPEALPQLACCENRERCEIIFDNAPRREGVGGMTVGPYRPPGCEVDDGPRGGGAGHDVTRLVQQFELAAGEASFPQRGPGPHRHLAAYPRIAFDPEMDPRQHPGEPFGHKGSDRSPQERHMLRCRFLQVAEERNGTNEPAGVNIKGTDGVGGFVDCVCGCHGFLF